jgi:spore maturation protein CgeB
LKKLLNPGAASWSQFSDQIKGRNFELPGCAAFQLSGQAENLATYLTPGREIALYDSTDDLVDKIRHYLKHEDERAAIARGGYERTLREHTWVHRFTEVLLRMGFTVPPAEAILSHPPQPGSVLEIAPREAAAVAL